MVYSRLTNINASTGAWVQLGPESGEMDIALYGSVAFNLRTPFNNVTDATNAAGTTDFVSAGSVTIYVMVDPSKTYVRGNSGGGFVSYIRMH